MSSLHKLKELKEKKNYFFYKDITDHVIDILPICQKSLNSDFVK